MKKIFALSFLSVFAIFVAKASVDVQVPFKIINAYSVFDFEDNFYETDLAYFPLAWAGPIRVSYVFDRNETKPFYFSAGLSSYFWPMQTICVSGSAFFKLYEFKNQNTLELLNVLDLGYAHSAWEYFDADSGNRTLAHYNYFCAGYNLSLIYRTSHFLFGFGPRIEAAFSKNSFMLYGFELSVSYRFKSSSKNLNFNFFSTNSDDSTLPLGKVQRSIKQTSL